jgi:endonuclease/exonuclease/phosphatase family metal-dependent hydrolase
MRTFQHNVIKNAQLALMKLITWNIQWGLGIDGRVDLERIVATARDLANFDVLCLQELADNFTGLEGHDGGDQFSEIAERLLPEYRLFGVFGVDVAGEGGRRRRFGNAIATRYDVLSVRRHALPWPADAGKQTMPRAAVELTLRTPMGPVRVTTTHLEYYSEIQRRSQAARLRELHEEASARAAHPGLSTAEGGPFDATPQTAAAILTGDFNFPPDHPAYAEIQKQGDPALAAYRDAWPLVHGRRPHVPTFCVHSQAYSKAPYCCDFVFVSGEAVPRVRSIAVDSETTASDHQPVLLELDDR